MSKTWGALRRRLESCGDLRTRFAEAESPRFYWLSADRQTELAAFGEIAAVETRGPRRLATAARRVAELLGRVAVTGDSAPPAAGPLVVGGFGFWDSAERDRLWAGYPALRFWLPAELRTRVGGTAYQLALESVARPLAPQPTPRLTSSSS